MRAALLQEAVRRTLSLADIILSPYASESDDDEAGSSSASDGCSSGDDGDDDSGADEAEADHVGLGAAWDPFAHARCVLLQPA